MREKEALAIKWAIETFRSFIYNTKFLKVPREPYAKLTLQTLKIIPPDR